LGHYYPVLITRDGQGLILSSPFYTSFGWEVKEFKGQTNPILAKGPIPVKPDTLLISKLKELWIDTFIQGQNSNISKRIFRSLNTAYLAASCWAPNEASIYDIGLKLALYVSAIEILLKPVQGEVNKRQVFRALDDISQCYFKDERLKSKKYELKSQETERYAFLSKIYSELYGSRNDFLHGNQVEINNLFLFKKEKYPSLWKIAPLLYYILLYKELGIINDYSGFKAELHQNMVLNSHRDSIERAFLCIY